MTRCLFAVQFHFHEFVKKIMYTLKLPSEKGGFVVKITFKLLLNGAIAVTILLWLTRATFWEAAIASVVLSVIAYLGGDQYVLRISNNTVATLVDAVLAFVYFWVVASLLRWNLSIGGLIFLTLFLGVGEAVYHRFLASDREKEKVTG